MTPNIDIQIEKLVLRGFSMHDAHLIRDAVESQLAQHFQAKGFSQLPTEIHLEQLIVQPISLKTGYQATSLGHEVADSVFNGITNLGSEK